MSDDVRTSGNDLPKGAEQAAEAMGNALAEAGLLTPGEARQWIEDTKDDMQGVEDDE